jgi:hypothetical protein
MASAGPLPRRQFLTNAAKAVAVGAIAPAVLARQVSAETGPLHEFLVRKLADAHTPGIAVAVVRGDEVV